MERKFKIKKKSRNKIRIATYNILGQCLVKYHKEKHVNPKIYEWNYRFNKIKNEVIKYSPDIFCFQEVQNNLFYNSISPTFRKGKYFGLFVPQKTHKKDTRLNKCNGDIGVSVFFRTTKYNLIDFHTFNYLDHAKKYLKKSNNLKFLDRINRRFSCLIMIFEEIKTSKKFLFSTVHLESSPLYEDVKNFQMYILLQHIQMMTKNKMPVIIAGDFNSRRNSSTYVGMITGNSINKYNQERLHNKNKEFIKTPKNFTEINFKSAYKSIFGKEPKYTNYTKQFKDTLDYIFVNDKIRVIGALQEIEPQKLERYRLLPNNQLPSDHIIQVADIELK
tara:strand:+ start:1166 stop:2161 length:996 start_codon:yes stop_codon:yes gene_type:complete